MTHFCKDGNDVDDDYNGIQFHETVVNDLFRWKLESCYTFRAHSTIWWMFLWQMPQVK